MSSFVIFVQVRESLNEELEGRKTKKHERVKPINVAMMTKTKTMMTKNKTKMTRKSENMLQIMLIVIIVIKPILILVFKFIWFSMMKVRKATNLCIEKDEQKRDKIENLK